ncbi:hypothetical protein [Paenibacillus sp. GCM10012303]
MNVFAKMLQSVGLTSGTVYVSGLMKGHEVRAMAAFIRSKAADSK